MRTFIALPCPKEIKEELFEIQQKIKDFGNIKLVEIEKIHATLKFLGEIQEEEIEEIEKTMDNLFSNLEKFTVEIKGLGAFPHLGYMKVVWAGVEKGEEKIKRLHQQLEERLEKKGFRKNKRHQFQPHFTIARVKNVSDKQKLQEIIKNNKKTLFGKYKVPKVSLMKSELSPKGPQYTELYRKELK